MARALLSVVMPTHDRSEKLLRAAQSALSQADVAVELIVVDDASSDRTPSVTEQLSQDGRVKVIRNDHASDRERRGTWGSVPPLEISSAFATAAPGSPAPALQSQRSSSATQISASSPLGIASSTTGPAQVWTTAALPPSGPPSYCGSSS